MRILLLFDTFFFFVVAGLLFPSLLFVCVLPACVLCVCVFVCSLRDIIMDIYGKISTFTGRAQHTHTQFRTLFGRRGRV